MVLISYWPLDGDAEDVRGGNNGSVTGGMSSGSDGILGTTSYDNDGTGYIDTGNSFSGLKAVSFSAWVLFHNVSDDNRYNGIFGAWSSGFDNYTRLSQNSSLNNWTFQIEGGSSNSLVVEEPVNTNQWYHVVGVYTGEGLNLYLNGKLIGTGGSSIGSTPDNGNMKIAGIPGYGGSDDIFLDGKIAEARIYDHALTRQEVHYLYSVGERGLHVSDRRGL